MKSLVEQTDDELCALAAAGEASAEEELAARYIRLVRVCARPYFLAGGDSEDLIQEGMIGLLSAIRGYSAKRETGFRTYAETCIQNRLRSAVRAAARNKHTPLNQSIPLPSQYEGNVEPFFYGTLQEQLGDPEDMLISREERESRMSALRSRLSRFEKTVLDRYLEGLSYVEIAEVLGKPLKSVDNAVQRIRRKVAPFLTSGEFSAS